MMTKKILTILSALLVLSFSGCKKNIQKKEISLQKENENQVLEKETLEKKEFQSVRVEKITEKADVDFTPLNYNMASAQVFEMMINEESYVGKSVRIKGKFYTDIGEYGRFFSVFYYDATACCQTGLSFVLSKDKTFPEDYPQDLEDIEIYGIYKTGEAGGLSTAFVEVYEYCF